MGDLMIPVQRPQRHLSMTTAVVLEVEESGGWWVCGQLHGCGAVPGVPPGVQSILNIGVWPSKFNVFFDGETSYSRTHRVLILPIAAVLQTQTNWYPTASADST